MIVTKYLCDKCGKETESDNSNYYRLIIEKQQERTSLDLCKNCIEKILECINIDHGTKQ